MGTLRQRLDNVWTLLQVLRPNEVETEAVHEKNHSLIEKSDDRLISSRTCDNTLRSYRPI